MGTTLGIDGSATGAVKAVGDVNKELDKTTAAADKAAKATKLLEDQAKKLAAQVDPQAKYNQQIEKLNQLATTGKLTTDQIAAAQRKYREELEKSTQSADAFSGSLAGMFAQYGSLAAAANLATRAITDSDAARKRSADEAVRARAGLGSLSQLAAAGAKSPADAERRNSALVAEARGFIGVGAAADENEAGNLLFELASAGLGRKDRAFAAQLRSAGTLTNVGGAAASYDALRTALGRDKVGSFRQFMSEALQGASVAPGSFEGLPIAAAQAGGSAKALGVSAESLFAATALIGKQEGSVSEGGTKLAAFLKQVEKSGLKGVQGIGLTGIVEKIAALPERQQGFGGVLGDRAEAVSGFRVLRDNIGKLRDLDSSIGGARGSDLAGLAVGLPGTDPSQRAALANLRAGGRLQQTESDLFAERTNLLAAARKDLLESTGGGLSYFSQRMLQNVGGVQDYLFGSSDAQLATFARQEKEERAAGGGRLSNDTLSAIESHLRQINQKSSSEITTRQR